MSWSKYSGWSRFENKETNDKCKKQILLVNSYINDEKKTINIWLCRFPTKVSKVLQQVLLMMYVE